jgi:hypothetical protein
MKQKKSIVFLLAESASPNETTVSVVMYEPPVLIADDNILIAIANLCIRTLGKRHGLDRARDMVESTLFSK